MVLAIQEEIDRAYAGRSDAKPKVVKATYVGYASARLGEFRQPQPRAVGSMDGARAVLSSTV